MNIFRVLNYLQTKNNINWLNGLDDFNEVQPFILNKWLSMDKELQRYVRFLDKYTFYLEPKQFLMLAWSVLPKKQKIGFNKYIKKNKELEEEYNFLIIRIRKVLEISDNDWKIIKKYYIQDIEENKIEYFKSFGVNKKKWKKFNLDYKKMKEVPEIQIENKNNLNKWF